MKRSGVPAHLRAQINLAQHDHAGLLSSRPRGSKYGVAAAAERTWRGVRYDSKAEMLYAQVLDLQLQGGELASVEHQPVVELGPSRIRYVPDFVIVDRHGVRTWIDVKGALTPVFKLKKRLWKSHGPGELALVKRRRGRFVVIERVAGPGQEHSA